jgi:hypothetical protein
MSNPIPEGYRRNALGHLIPVEMIKPADLDRDELVVDLCRKAQNINQKMRDFKKSALADIVAFVQLAAERYGHQMGGANGNINLTSLDGAHQVRVSVNQLLTFNEGINVAKSMIDECLHRWTEGSRAEVRALIEHAFQADSQGQLSIGRILSLRKIAIDDDQWKAAMQAITDAVEPSGSAQYIRFYQRSGQDAYTQIPLEMSKL